MKNKNPMVRYSRYPHDSALILAPEVELKGGAGLYRFRTYGEDGKIFVERSAIYDGDCEIAWHSRDREQDMIEWWNN